MTIPREKEPVAGRDQCKVDLERHNRPAPPVCRHCGPDGEKKGLCPFWRQA